MTDSRKSTLHGKGCHCATCSYQLTEGHPRIIIEPAEGPSIVSVLGEDATRELVRDIDAGLERLEAEHD